jgi:hypothetical protein
MTTQALLDYSALAQRYSDWAVEQISLAEKAGAQNYKAGHILLAERYLRLAEQELIAAQSEPPTDQSSLCATHPCAGRCAPIKTGSN